MLQLRVNHVVVDLERKSSASEEVGNPLPCRKAIHGSEPEPTRKSTQAQPANATATVHTVHVACTEYGYHSTT